MARATDPVREYYERNTRLFLGLGAGGRAGAIHRAVWAPGVANAEEAFHYANQLVAEEAARLPGPDPIHILDLGCGVGGSLFHLARRLQRPFRATGVTLSPLQARLAAEEADRRGARERCRFIEADFLDLPPLDPADLIYSIEAFAHAPGPERYFEQAARVLKPGGRLALIDDFLTAAGAAAGLTASSQRRLLAYREGWRVPGLSAVPDVGRMAAEAGLRLIADRDLTPHLRLARVAPGLADVALRAMRLAPASWAYWHSTRGSLALQACLRSGLVAYRFLAFSPVCEQPTAMPLDHGSGDYNRPDAN
jgi:tocopherol O-methyltransferase